MIPPNFRLVTGVQTCALPISPLDSKMTDASTMLGEGFQSTPENQALTRDPLSCKVWSTGIELAEKAMTEMCPPAAEFMSQDQSVIVEPLGPR